MRWFISWVIKFSRSLWAWLPWVICVQAVYNKSKKGSVEWNCSSRGRSLACICTRDNWQSHLQVTNSPTKYPKFEEIVFSEFIEHKNSKVKPIAYAKSLHALWPSRTPRSTCVHKDAWAFFLNSRPMMTQPSVTPEHQHRFDVCIFLNKLSHLINPTLVILQFWFGGKDT